MLFLNHLQVPRCFIRRSLFVVYHLFRCLQISIPPRADIHTLFHVVFAILRLRSYTLLPATADPGLVTTSRLVWIRLRYTIFSDGASVDTPKGSWSKLISLLNLFCSTIIPAIISNQSAACAGCVTSETHL